MAETPEEKKAREVEELKQYLAKLEEKNNKAMQEKGEQNPYAGS